jgi:hypothetical protein
VESSLTLRVSMAREPRERKAFFERAMDQINVSAYSSSTSTRRRNNRNLIEFPQVLEATGLIPNDGVIDTTRSTQI